MMAEANINSGKKPLCGKPTENPHQLNSAAIATQETLGDELRLALCAIPAGILFVNRFGIVELVNNSATSLFGENLEGACWRDVIDKHFMPQKGDGLEVSLQNGRKVKFSISSLPQRPGQLIHLTDLTTTRALQSKLSHMEKLSSLGKMVASLAHQLRTPLSAAMLYAMNLSSPNLKKPMQERFSAKLVSRLKDLENQINDMLLFAKSGSSGVLENIDIVALLRRIVDEVRESCNLESQSIRFVSELQSCHLTLNSNAIQGAISNLIENAIESGASEIEIAFVQNNKAMAISVSDNGPGIPETLKKHIFEPFYTTRAQGTGLGLAVVSAVAKSHKGSVQVSNIERGGTKFTISLPLCLKCKDETSNNSSDAINSILLKNRLAGEIA